MSKRPARLIAVIIFGALLYELVRWLLLPHLSPRQADIVMLGVVVLASTLSAFSVTRWPAKAAAIPTPVPVAQEPVAQADDLTEAQADSPMPEGDLLFDALVSANPVAITISDREHRIRLTNPAFTRMFGYSPEDCIGRLAGTLIVPVKTEADATSQEHMDAVTTAGVTHGSGKRRRKDGTLVDVEFYEAQIVFEGAFCGVLALYQDITERLTSERALRQSEEIFRMLCATAPVGIFLTDATGGTVYGNERLTEITGITPEQAYDNNRWSESIYIEDRERAMTLWRHAVQSGEELIDQHRIVKPGGETIWVSVRARWARGADGKQQSFVGVIEDITALQQANEVMRAAKEAAEAGSKAKGEFLANMSHEIRTPMNGILGMTELALDTELNAEQRDLLTTAHESAQTLVSVINDILDFSKIEAGKLEVELLPFNVRELVEWSIKAFALRAHQKKLELAYEVSLDCPSFVMGDAMRLRQVLSNLLGNAIKFTLLGEIVLRVIAKQGELGPVLQFSVSDTGIGIPLHKQKVVFEAFSQADASTTRSFGGTGLGLSISYGLVELMYGKLWLEAGNDGGSIFSFRIPLLPAEGIESPSPRFPSIRDMQHVHVLIVDDNVTNRQILERILANWRLRAGSVEDGKSALRAMAQAKIEDDPYTLVLIDYQMPEMDGFELARRIKSTPELSDSLIMMLTSDDFNATTSRCRELGIKAQLIKPIKQQDLLAAMRQVLGGVPLVPSPAAEAAEVRATPETPARKLRILLAEDNLVNQKLAVKLLERKGHTVSIADNGKEAVALFQNHTYDLVLMDIQMPEMDGMEATAAIRNLELSLHSHIPILAMTANAMMGDRERCLAGGMDGYLAKPINTTELFKLIHSFGV